MEENETPERSWKPLTENGRRVLGVLIEKAKTTPDNYPITLAALKSGCNQKSNRDPQLQLDGDDIYIALEELRTAGVAVEVQGGGRVSKYRHTAYDWFDVKGPEIAVVTELLLRGPQTLGEIRSRASRMAPFADMAALQPVIDSLQTKELIFPLSPPGRGQQFSHALYEEDELERLRTNASQTVTVESTSPSRPSAELETLQTEVRELTELVHSLRDRLDILES